jgi:hypothetical protein
VSACDAMRWIGRPTGLPNWSCPLPAAWPWHPRLVGFSWDGLFHWSKAVKRVPLAFSQQGNFDVRGYC